MVKLEDMFVKQEYVKQECKQEYVKEEFNDDLNPNIKEEDDDNSSLDPADRFDDRSLEGAIRNLKLSASQSSLHQKLIGGDPERPICIDFSASGDSAEDDVEVVKDSESDNITGSSSSGDEKEIEYTPLSEEWVLFSDKEFEEWKPKWLKPFEEMFGLQYEILPEYMKDKIATNRITPIDCFLLFFDKDVLDAICAESNRYAAAYFKKLLDKNQNIPIYLKNFEYFEPRIIILFIACLLYMGLVNMPEKKLHWNREGFFPRTILAQVMSRDTFYLVSKFLHLANDETANKEDRLHKVRPFCDMLIRNWQKYYKCSRDVTIDEKMIRFDGVLKFKQHIPSKPVKHGIKSFLLAEASTGFTYNEEIYCGRVLEENEDESVSSITGVVCRLLEGFSDKGHRLFVDNFFTSYEMVKELESRNIGCSGTLRKNRKNIPKQINDNNGKLKRGDMIAYKLGNAVAFVWREKKCVRFMTNLTGGFEEKDLNTKTGPVKVKKPCALLEYNDRKNGVDKANQLEVQYQFHHRDMKWWKRIFISFIDTTIVNSMIIYKMLKPSISQAIFRREIIFSIFNMCRNDFFLSFIESHHELDRRKPSDCVVCKKKKKRTQSVFYCKGCMKTVCPEHFVRLHEKF